MRAPRLPDQLSRLAALALVGLLPAACAVLTGLDELEVDPEAGSSGQTDACQPGALEACYTGPSATEGVGSCHSGTRTCDTTGHWRACEGEGLPAEENCATADDEDCNGSGWYESGDTDCLCQPGMIQDCYTGPDGTAGVGICRSGTGTCNIDGRSFVDCQGEVLPALEDDCSNDATDDDCDGTPCAGDVLWALAASGSGAQGVHDLAVDSDGNLVVVGQFNGELTLGSTALTSQGVDAFILKLSGDGQPIWALQLGPGGNQRAQAVAVDPTGAIYVAGEFEDALAIEQTTLSSSSGAGDFDLFVLKLSPEGDLVWVRDYGNTRNQFAGGIAATGTTGVALTGKFNGSLNFGDGDLDTTSNVDDDNIYVAHLDASGGPLWSYSSGDQAVQSGTSIAVGDDVYVTGHLRGILSSGGANLDGGSASDVLVMRRALASGAHVWAKDFDLLDDANHAGLDIAVDSSSNVLITGEFGGYINFDDSFGTYLSTSADPGGFIAKLDSSGAYLWSKGFGSGALARGRSVAADAGNNALITGEFQGTVSFGGGNLSSSGVDVFVAKLAPDGTHVWSRRFGDNATQRGIAVAADPGGDVLVTGTFQGSMVLGNTTVTANNSSADPTLFIAKLAR